MLILLKKPLFTFSNCEHKRSKTDHFVRFLVLKIYIYRNVQILISLVRSIIIYELIKSRFTTFYVQI